MSVISVENLTHTYSIGTPFERTAISDICVNIRQGERVCILGHTGSGKTTFVQHLNALLQPSSGRVLVDGEDINRDKISRRDIKFKIGLVFQYPEYQLLNGSLRLPASLVWMRNFLAVHRWNSPADRNGVSPLPA